MIARRAAFVLVALLLACNPGEPEPASPATQPASPATQPASPATEPAAGSGAPADAPEPGQDPTATGGADAPQGPAVAVLPTIEEEKVDPVAAGAHGHAHGGAADERSATARVTDALYSGRYAAGQALRARLPQPAAPAQTEGDTTRVRIAFGSNVHGELEDCGCRRHPLGGLARRATLVDEWLAEDDIDIGIHLDAGDALFRTPRRRPELDPETAHEAIGARAVLAAFARTGLGAMAVGHKDLTLGGTFLSEAADDARIAILTSNVTFDGRPIGIPSVWLGDDEFRIGVVGVTAEESGAQELPPAQGVEISPAAPAIVDRIRGLRADGADLVVLLGGSLGIAGAEALLAALGSEAALPDVVLVSGTNRLVREPVWAQSVPVLEAGNRGKQLMVLDLFVADGAPDFAPRDSGLGDLVDQYISTLRALNMTDANLRRVVDDPARISQREAYLRLQRNQLAQLDRVFVRMRAARPQLTAPAPEGPPSRLEVRLHEVELEIAERDDVKALVDEAMAAMAEDPAYRPRH